MLDVKPIILFVSFDPPKHLVALRRFQELFETI